MESVRRVISVFDKKSELFIDEVDVSHLSIHFLTHIFNPPENDPLMYDNYWINEDTVHHFQAFMEFDLDQNIYQLECFSVL